MKTEFKQIRSIVKGDENIALQKACKALQCDASELTTAHTEKVFVFKLNRKSTATAGTDPGLFPVEKTPETTLQNARQLAMKHFNTFEGNIKIVDQDETHFVFAKVRQ